MNYTFTVLMYARTDFVVWVCVFMCICIFLIGLKRFVFPQRVQGILHPKFELNNIIFIIIYIFLLNYDFFFILYIFLKYK